MGEVLLRDRLARAGVPARVRSAGLVSDGVPASAHGVRAMAQRGLDLTPHRSRVMTADDVRSADLVVAMAREHLREAVAAEPEAFGRTFTLRELARRATAAGPRRPLPGRDEPEPLERWLHRVAAGRRVGDLLGDDPADDVADPIGRSRRAYERCARDIEALVDQVVAHAFPTGRSRSYSA